MQLVQVRDLAQRPASPLSIIVNYLFGGKMPGEFIPGHPYNKGDTVYKVSDDGYSISLWVCNIAGSYEKLEEPYWSEFSLNKFITEKLQKLAKLLYDPHPQMYSLSQTCGTRDVTNLVNAIAELENTPSYMDVFYDGKLVKPTDCEIIDDELRGTGLTDASKLIVDFYTPSNDLSRLIRRVNYLGDIVPYKESSTSVTGATHLLPSEWMENSSYRVTLPQQLINQYASYGFEVYVDGYIMEEGYDYRVEYPSGKSPYIEFFNKEFMDDFYHRGLSNMVNKKYLQCSINFMVSVSDNVCINHKNYRVEVYNDMDSYDIDITDSGYINVFQTMSVFINKKRAKTSMFHFSKGFLNVKNLSDYLKRRDVLTVSVMSFIPNEYKYSSISNNERRYITESVYTVENNTRLVPIPFIGFNEDLDDFIIFNENGALISSAKYYIDNDYIRYYSHDQGVYIGDTLNFKMIDRNMNTTMRTFILTAEETNQTEFRIPNAFASYNSYDKKNPINIFCMVFYSSGAYISPYEYDIDGYNQPVPEGGTLSLLLTHDMTLDPGDRLEVILFTYPKGLGSTCMDYHRIPVMAEKTNTFELDFDYDPEVTSFLIFANTGLYIGEEFYEISDDNILTIKGEEVYRGGWIDIIVVQTTESLTSIDGEGILNLL